MAMAKLDILEYHDYFSLMMHYSWIEVWFIKEPDVEEE